MQFDMNQSISREEMNAGRQRAILITIDYEGQSIYGDEKRYRGRAICIHAPRGFSYADVQTPGSASPGPVDADAEIPF